MRRWWCWLTRQMPRQRTWWWLLLAINLVGSYYGFWWYRHQLAATPMAYWLVVPDSPGSTLLFAFFLMALLAGARPGWLGALAFLSLMKYGLWTAIVLPYHAISTGSWTFADIHLSLSHFGMWAQGIIFARIYPPPLRWALAAWAWMYFQDYVDYVWGLHPTLPSPGLFGPAAVAAVGLSTIWGAALVWLAGRGQQGAPPL